MGGRASPAECCHFIGCSRTVSVILCRSSYCLGTFDSESASILLALLHGDPQPFYGYVRYVPRGYVTYGRMRFVSPLPGLLGHGTPPHALMAQCHVTTSREGIKSIVRSRTRGELRGVLVNVTSRTQYTPRDTSRSPMLAFSCTPWYRKVGEVTVQWLVLGNSIVDEGGGYVDLFCHKLQSSPPSTFGRSFRQ